MSAKHFKLLVPHYTNDDSDNQEWSPLTYMQLGAPPHGNHLGGETVRGDALVKDLFFKDDSRDPAWPNKSYLRDDGVSVDSAADRTTLTGELLTRGGWREHTDGNRLSTTRGDCVEVVQGNYKLVVLGRVAADWDPNAGDAGNAAASHVGRTRTEVSGGHYNESTSTPGEVLSISWSTQEDGTWQVTEETEGGDSKEIYHGWLKEEFYGDSISEKIGVETGTHKKETPKIVEKTFARSIKTTETIDTSTEETTVTGGIITDTTKAKTKHKTETFAKKMVGFSLQSVGIEHLNATTIVDKNPFTGWRKNIGAGGVGIGISAITSTVTQTKGRQIGINMGYAMSADFGASAAMVTHFKAAIAAGSKYEQSMKVVSIGLTTKTDTTLVLLSGLVTGVVGTVTAIALLAKITHLVVTENVV